MQIGLDELRPQAEVRSGRNPHSRESGARALGPETERPADAPPHPRTDGDDHRPRDREPPPRSLTTCNTVGVSVNVSVRLDDRLAERLRLRARAAGESLSDRLRRYAEEGARRDEHPMITFRDGPTGRRAGLIAGPDVWEVAMWIDDLGSSDDPAMELAADGIVTRPQIDAALAYRAAYPDEIQARIDLHRSETVAAEAR